MYFANVGYEDGLNVDFNIVIIVHFVNRRSISFFTFIRFQYYFKKVQFISTNQYLDRLSFLGLDRVVANFRRFNNISNKTYILLSLNKLQTFPIHRHRNLKTFWQQNFPMKEIDMYISI